MIAQKARQTEQEATRFVQIKQISTLFLKSTANWLVERALTNKTLAAADVASSETHDKIVRLREAADPALKDAVDRLKDVPEMKNSQQLITEADEVFREATLSKSTSTVFQQGGCWISPIALTHESNAAHSTCCACNGSEEAEGRVSSPRLPLH